MQELYDNLSCFHLGEYLSTKTTRFQKRWANKFNLAVAVALVVDPAVTAIEEEAVEAPGVAVHVAAVEVDQDMWRWYLEAKDRPVAVASNRSRAPAAVVLLESS